jgi:5-methylcytosine-specific restriction endonuclease McrA
MRFRAFAPRAKAWRSVRRAHLANHPTCAACGTRHLLDVHHIKPFHLFPALELDPRNLMTLCRWRRHHFKIGHHGDWTRWNETAREDAARLLGSK